MAVITLPPVSANSMQLSLTRGDSPLGFFDGSEVIIASRIALWTVSMRLRPLKAVDYGRQWFAALSQLSNLENTCLIDPVGLVRSVQYSGPDPLVVGTGQLGLTLNIDGATPSAQLGQIGDVFSVNGEFKILTQNATASGSGTCTLNFEPALRAAPPDNAVVNFKTPKIVARLVNPVAELDALLSGHYDIRFNMIETYRP